MQPTKPPKTAKLLPAECDLFGPVSALFQARLPAVSEANLKSGEFRAKQLYFLGKIRAAIGRQSGGNRAAIGQNSGKNRAAIGRQSGSNRAAIGHNLGKNWLFLPDLCPISAQSLPDCCPIAARLPPEFCPNFARLPPDCCPIAARLPPDFLPLNAQKLPDFCPKFHPRNPRERKRGATVRPTPVSSGLDTWNALSSALATFCTEMSCSPPPKATSPETLSQASLKRPRNP